MDVRIGIVQSMKELDIELPDDADRDKVLADIEEALARRAGSSGSPTARDARSGCRRPRSPTSRSTRPPPTAGSGSGSPDPAPGSVRPRHRPDPRGRRAADPMTPLLDRKLLFVTGKGGTGKTTVASALALLAAAAGQAGADLRDRRQGRAGRLLRGPAHRLQGEGGPPGPLRHVDGHRGVAARVPQAAAAHAGDRPHRTGGQGLRLRGHRRPGVREILTVGKLCYEVRERHYDLVVVDAPATGHIVGQLAAPQAINELVKVGLIRTQTDWMLEILSDPATTGLVAVCTPEEMPVTETIELAGRITRRDHGAAGRRGGQPGAARAVRTPGGAGLRRPEHGPRRWPKLNELVGGDAGPVLDAARLAVTMRRTRATHLERLRSGHRPRRPLLYLPYLFTRSHGLRTTRQVAESLGEELGF